MKCYNCNHDFEGNFCPKCGIPAVNTPLNETPYEQSYSQTDNYQPAADYQQNAGYQQTQNYQPQPYQQGYVQPQQYVPQVPKKGMSTGGKIAALVISITVGVILYYCAIGFGCVMCMDSFVEMLDNIDSSYNDLNDTSYHGIGSSVSLGDLNYRLASADYSDTYGDKKVADGKQFVTINIEVENTASRIRENEVYYNLYSDDSMVHEIDSTFPDDFGHITLPPGKKGNYKIVYEIPKQFEKLELYMEVAQYDDFGFHTFIFTIENQ